MNTTIKGPEMVLDQGTIRDLELLAATDGASGVIALLDRTVTRDGSAALQRRLLEPMSSAAHIRRVQAAVAFLCRRQLRFFTTEPEVAAVKRYLSSNVESVAGRSAPGRAAESLWLRFRYPDLFTEIEEGVGSARRFLRSFDDFCKRLSTDDAPLELRERGTACRDLLESPDLSEVLGSARGRSVTLAHDRLLRRSHLDAMRQLLAAAAEFDALISMARITTELGWVLPECVDSDDFVLEGEGLYHPVLTDPVANRVRVSGGATLVFLTGPNMAGKTTYLRTVALAMLLAHAGREPSIQAGRVRVREHRHE